MQTPGPGERSTFGLWWEGQAAAWKKFETLANIKPNNNNSHERMLTDEILFVVSPFVTPTPGRGVELWETERSDSSAPPPSIPPASHEWKMALRPIKLRVERMLSFEGGCILSTLTKSVNASVEGQHRHAIWLNEAWAWVQHTPPPPQGETARANNECLDSGNLRGGQNGLFEPRKSDGGQPNFDVKIYGNMRPTVARLGCENKWWKPSIEGSNTSGGWYNLC